VSGAGAVATASLNDRLTLTANLGVVVGLAILIVELNQANQLAESQAHVLRLDQMQQAQVAFAESDELPQIELKALNDGVQLLSDLERSKFRRWHTSVMLRMQSHYYHYEQGYLDDETGQEVLNAAADSLALWKQFDVKISNKRFLRVVEEVAAAR
jgi:hypothetical protein